MTANHEAVKDKTTSDDPRSVEVEKAWRTWPVRVANGLLGGTIVGAVACGLDAWWARQVIAEDAGSPGWGALFFSGWGVSAPIVWSVALAFALLSLVSHPRRPLSFSIAKQWLRDGSSTQRLNRALVLPIGIVGAWVWVVIGAHVARWLMSTIEDARAAGLALAAAAGLAGIMLFLIGIAVFTALRTALSSRRRDVRARFQAWWTGGLALLLCLGMGMWGLFCGSTGGEGGIFGFMGVLKRLELDLRAPFLLLMVGMAAFLAPILLKRLLWPLALLLSLAPLGLTFHAATALDDAPRVAAALEQSSPLASPSLRALRRLTDRDGDGASPFFGGGDCNDKDPAIHPLAADIPGDGIDQDCSGADLPLPEPVEESVKVAQNPRDALEDGLNVLLITIDTLRWDMGFMGYPRNISPALDALAQVSTVFEHTYAMSTYTGKAIGPMMSGKYPSETHMGWSHYNTYPKADIMVQERLQEAGIPTIGIHCHWYFKKETGLGRGFDLFDISALPPQGIDATTDTTYSADRLSDAAIKVFSDETNTSKRFFAWIHYFDPHAEYLHHPGTEEFGRKARDMYDHEVRWTIDQMGRVLDFVKEQPWGKKTAIIVTADHAEAFGEHGMYRHGFEVWDEVVRVPLVIHVPGQKPKRIKEKRSLVDLVPTILDLMKVGAGEPKHDTDFLSGVSLLPELLSEPGTQQPLREILVDMPPGPYNQARRAYVRGDMKLIIAGGVRYQLFDLKQDPGEKQDLSDDKELLSELRGHYDRFRAKLKEVPLKPR